ncbi:MAG: hypothetical protein ACK4QW_12145 [Alphaproteobacteria bacterium]
MSAPRKFLFDVSFDDDAAVEAAEPEAEAPPPPVFTEEDVARVREEALVEGQAAGERAERMRSERLAAEAAERLVARLNAIDDQIAAIGPAAERRGVECGLAVARKLVPELLRRGGADEIEAVVRGALRDMFEEPRIVLRVSDGVLDLIRSRIEDLAARSGFGGRIVILTEEGMVDGDCRVEWPDGGVERSAARLSAQIETAVARALTGIADICPDQSRDTAGRSTDATHGT